MTWVEKQTADNLQIQTSLLPFVQWKSFYFPSQFARWKDILLAPILAALLFLISHCWADAQNVSNQSIEKVEVSSTILDILNQKVWVKLPTEYIDKISNFITNNKTLQKEIAAKFTEDFIVKEMQSDWWINKQNQLLFIYCAIWYNYNQDFYTWEDWDKNRLSEFEKVIDFIEDCQRRYKEEFISYMQQRSADADRRISDADRRISDADRRSAEAIKKIMQQDSIWLKKIMIEFYKIYVRNPNAVKKEDIDFAKESTKTIIGDCKKFWIDYRAILLKEVWDKRKVDKILDYYGVE